MAVNRELLIVAGVAILLIVIGAVLAGFGSSPLEAPVLSASVEDGRVLLSWQGEGDAFRIYRSTQPGVEGELIATVDVTAYADNPGPGTYYYKVKAVKGSQESPFSNEVEVTLTFPKPVIEEVVPSFGECLTGEVATFDVVGQHIERCSYSFDGESWSEPMDVPLQVAVPEGVGEIYIKCYNKGVESDTFKLSFIVDRLPPTVSLINPYVEDGLLKGTLEADEPVSCSITTEDGRELASLSVEGSAQLSVPLPLGRYLLTITCSDACGNPALIYYEAENLGGALPNETEEKSYYMDMVINDGDRYTYSRSVVLKITTYNLTECRFANEEDYPEEWSSWVRAEEGEWERAWLLSADYGRKKVYMQCRDGDTIVGEVYDTIYYRSTGGGGGGTTPTASASITAYGTAYAPALVEGLNTLPLGEEGIPMVALPEGMEGFTAEPTVTLAFSGSGETARYRVTFNGIPIYESEWDPAYVSGRATIRLPILLPPNTAVAYEVVHEVAASSTTASVSTTITYDPVPPRLERASVSARLTDPTLGYALFDVSYAAEDRESGIAGYVLEVKFLDKFGREVAHYAYYKRAEGEKVEDTVLILPRSSSYRAKLYVVDKVGNMVEESFSGTIPVVESPVQITGVEAYDMDKPTAILHSRPVATISAVGAEECAVCLFPIIGESTSRECTYYRPFTEPETTYKIDFAGLPSNYEGNAYLSVACRKESYSDVYTAMVPVDLSAPRITMGEAVIRGIPIIDIITVHVPVEVRDVHLTEVEVCTQRGVDGEWSTTPPEDVNITMERCENYTAENGRVSVTAADILLPSRSNEYIRVVVRAYDEVNHYSEAMSDWLYPVPSTTAEGGNTGEEYLPYEPSEKEEPVEATQ